MNFVAACKDYFGYQPGKGLQAFAGELRALSDQDRQEIKAGLEQNGYAITGDIPNAIKAA